jgi:hypothetical protein
VLYAAGVLLFGMKFLRTHRVGLTKQVTKSIVYLFVASEAKVMHEIAVEKRIYSVHDWMSSRSLKPDVSSKVAFPWRDGHKSPAGLEDDSGLLCVDVNWPDASRSAHKALKEYSYLRVLVREVFVNRVVTAGVRHVAHNKPLSTHRALPKRSLGLP